MYRMSKNKRWQVLLEQEKRVFRTAELGVLWGIEKQNTLLVTLSRYVRQGSLFRLQKGLYAVVPIEKLHPYEIGCALAGPLGYVSGEMVLFAEGLISQMPGKVTVMGRYEREVEIEGRTYWIRRMKPELLVDRWGIKEEGRYAVAGVRRAKFDLDYLTGGYYLDKEVR